MAMEKRTSLFVPCTPLGCLKILDREKINLEGMNAVVIGKSNIVGLPISLLLMKKMLLSQYVMYILKILKNILKKQIY